MKEELKSEPTYITEQRLYEIVKLAVKEVLAEKETKETNAETIERLQKQRTFNPYK